MRWTGDMPLSAVIVAVAVKVRDGEFFLLPGLAFQLVLRLLLGLVDLLLAGPLVERERDLDLRARAVELQLDGVARPVLGKCGDKIGIRVDLAAVEFRMISCGCKPAFSEQLPSVTVTTCGPEGRP